MTRNQPPLPTGYGTRLRERQTELAEDLVNRQFAERPELLRKYGPAGREKCRQDANHHLSHLADALDAGEPTLFASYVAWARAMLASRGIPGDDLARHLELTRTVVSQGLPDRNGALAAEYLGAALAQLPSFSTDLPSCLGSDRPLAGLALQYLDALLNGERHRASRMILDAVTSGTSVQSIYLDVFQPVQREIGRRWQLNEVSVAQEHYSTAATQLIMSQLYPQVFASPKGAGTMVAACVAGNLHEVGMRMVSDFFELEGWNTLYLGANMPAGAIVDTVVKHRAQVLGISATNSSHLRAVGDLIGQVRVRPECEGVKILVGGYAFLALPDLWRKMGADGTATDAQCATAVARQWISHVAV